MKIVMEDDKKPLKPVSFRVSEEDLATLAKKARKAGISASDYLRILIRYGEVEITVTIKGEGQ